MEKTKILWVDTQSSFFWQFFFGRLENEHNFEIAKIYIINEDDILQQCEGKKAVVIHTGTVRPRAEMKPLIEDIKLRFPEIRIGLQTEVIHPFLKGLADFYVTVNYLEAGDDHIEDFIADVFSKERLS